MLKIHKKLLSILFVLVFSPTNFVLLSTHGEDLTQEREMIKELGQVLNHVLIVLANYGFFKPIRIPVYKKIKQMWIQKF